MASGHSDAPVPRYSPAERALARASTPGNLLLDMLPGPLREQLWKGLEPRPHTPGERVRFSERGQHVVLFPLSAQVSQYIRMDNGNTAETATIGREGLLGLTSLLNPGTAEPEAMATVGGAILVVPGERITTALHTLPELSVVLLRYASLQSTQAGFTAACGRLHDARSRLARWLLLMDDRLTAPSVQLTHDTLAEVLGVRRPSITIAASVLQRAGCLSYSRGRLIVRDRVALLRWSCECYVPMRRLLAASIAREGA